MKDSLKSKCYCLGYSMVSRIQKFFLSANYGGWQYFLVFNSPSTLKSISPALLNQLPSTRFSLKKYYQSPESWANLPSLFCLFFQYFAPKKPTLQFSYSFWSFWEKCLSQVVDSNWKTKVHLHKSCSKSTQENHAFHKANAHPVF